MTYISPEPKLRRGVGRVRGRDGRYARVVDRLVVHGTPIPFRTLCERVVPKETRYLVLDLDRTLHLGRNMGELLGFEIGAYLAYGPEALARIADRRSAGRFAIDLREVRGTIRYFAIGVQMWAIPGLFYFVWAKLARLAGFARRASFLRFGPEPVRKVQSVPQITLLHAFTRLPLDTVRALMRDVWHRHTPDQVITAEDIAWLRQRCPGIRVILTSASPEPVVDVAAEMLGVDEVDSTAVDATDGRSAAPFGPGWISRRVARPFRIAPPSRVRINSSHAKIEGLLARHPDLLEPGVITVGITDTGYGEDHCWGDWFTHVVDVNSNSPFPPVVAVDSPLREVHSAHVLSRAEMVRKAEHIEDYLDSRRSPRPSFVDRDLSGPALESALADLLVDVEGVAASFDESEHRIAPARQLLEQAENAIKARVEDAVRAYNGATDAVRDAILAELDGLYTQVTNVAERLVEVERPVSEAAFKLTLLLEETRARLDRVLARA